MENAKGRNEKKKNQKWIILIRDYSIEKEKWHTHVQCRRNWITLKEWSPTHTIRQWIHVLAHSIQTLII
jgi:hypothetical protein